MEKIKSIFKFYSQVKQEAKKITWPTKNELMTSTWIVLLAVIIFSFIFLGLDFCISSLVNFLLKL